MKTIFCRVILGLLLAGGLARTCVADSFTWDAKQNRVTADVNGWPLPVLLEKIASVTDWQVFVEPGAAATASAKFRDRPMGDALKALLGDLSFAVVPQTNASTKLFVFHTSMQAATQMITVRLRVGKKSDMSKPIPNQLVVTVKPGVDINALAAKLGGKVIGKVDGMNTYLLEFPDDATTQAALAALKASADVVSVDYNYAIENPSPRLGQFNGTTPDFNLQAKALGDGNPVVVGLIDTGFDASQYCDDFSQFLLPGINVSGSTAAASSTPPHGGPMAITILHSIAANGSGKTSAKILPVNVYGTNATTTTFAVANGIYAAVKAGANIINLSLGSDGDSTFLHSIITSASGQGVLFFAAAGNEPVTTPTYPAAYPEVVAVTAGSRDGTVADYANRGSFVSVVAPGNSAVCYGGQEWLVQGTSSAAAVASGYAAALADSGKSADELKRILLNALPKPKP